MIKSILKKRNDKKLLQYLESVPLNPPVQLNYHKVKSLVSFKKKPQLLQMSELVAPDIFLDKLSKINTDYSGLGKATQKVGSEEFGRFLKKVVPYDNTKYVFHNILNDPIACKLVSNLIPVPSFIKKSFHQLRISRLYAGGKLSGARLHCHSEALNYLVSGKKLWIMLPFSEKNNHFVDQNGMRHAKMNEKNLTSLIDANSDSNHLIEGLHVFIQNTKEVVYVPSGCHHAVVNLENSFGITYSWI
tara:strand:- start:128 stop:862 length:735 start_codon:yes stop_codon:yes gene_type:complete